MSKSKKTSNKKQDAGITDEDRALFRNAVGNVEKMDNQRIIHKAGKPRPLPLQSQVEDERVIQQLSDAPFDIDEVETGDELSFHRAGIQKTTLKKLRKGYFVIQGELDLHGMTSVMAKTALNDFLIHSISIGRRCVRIIHGKGLGSINKKPVLKNKINLWLQQKEEVLAFCSAPKNDGGTGAVYVLLNQR